MSITNFFFYTDFYPSGDDFTAKQLLINWSGPNDHWIIVDILLFRVYVGQKPRTQIQKQQLRHINCKMQNTQYLTQIFKTNLIV